MTTGVKISELASGSLSADDAFVILDTGAGTRQVPVTILNHTGDVTGGVDGVLTLNTALLEHTGDVTGDAAGVTTIGSGVVTNAKLADMVEQRIKMRSTAGTGSVEDLKISELPEELTPSSGVYLLAEDGSGDLVAVDIANLPASATGEANTASNVGAGSGVFKQKSSLDLEFKSLTATDGSIALTDNASDVGIGVPTGGLALTKLADQSDLTILGNRSGGAGPPTAMTVAQTLTMLGLYAEEPAMVVAVDLNTDLVAAASTAVIAFPLPYDCDFSTLPEAYINTAPTGSAATVDIHLAGTTIFSTKITVDATENSSTDAAIPAVLSTSSGTKGQLVEIFVDAVGSTTPGTGLVVTMFLTQT